MAATAAVGSNDWQEKEIGQGLSPETSRRVDDAIKSYFDRLVERTEVPKHIYDLIMGAPKASDERESASRPA